MKRLLPLCLLFLAACSPLPPAEPGVPVILSLQRESSTDSLATVRTKATLAVSGAITEEILLFDGTGELLFVDPAAYGADTFAVFTAWWAGAGDEMRVRLNKASNELIVEQRSGDESGVCTEWSAISTIAVPANVQIGLTDFGEATPQSSLAWCDE